MGDIIDLEEEKVKLEKNLKEYKRDNQLKSDIRKTKIQIIKERNSWIKMLHNFMRQVNQYLNKLHDKHEGKNGKL